LLGDFVDLNGDIALKDGGWTLTVRLRITTHISVLLIDARFALETKATRGVALVMPDLTPLESS